MFDFQSHILSWITFLPILGVVLILFLKKEQVTAIKFVTLGIAALDMIFSLVLYGMFKNGTALMQFEENIPWASDFGINYHLGIDGLSLLMVVLTTILSFLAILSSWNSITKSVKGYYISMLFLLTGMLGVFVALDLFFFYVFWEVMLIPMYFLIGIWGGPRRIYASIKFVLFTMFGSLLMLVALLYLVFEHQAQTGIMTFDLLSMYDLNIPLGTQTWLFLAFALAFAIKVPIWPLHTWLPDAHVQAPTAGSVILAGVLLKMGTYGFLRICMPMFPEATIEYTPLFIALAIIGIIYGALVAMVQKDVKSLVAFSSVSHLGFVMLGMFALNPEGMNGSVLQMINHGISTGALFLIVGMIYERRHTRMIEDFGGIAKVMPVFATVFMIVTLSSIGLPLTNGFVGEFMILLGAFKANWIYGTLAATGVILAAVYMLWMFQRVIWGKITNKENEGLKDLTGLEKLILLPLVIAIFWIGLAPNEMFRKMEPAVDNILAHVRSADNAATVFKDLREDESEFTKSSADSVVTVGTLNADIKEVQQETTN